MDAAFFVLVSRPRISVFLSVLLTAPRWWWPGPAGKIARTTGRVQRRSVIGVTLEGQSAESDPLPSVLNSSSVAHCPLLDDINYRPGQPTGGSGQEKCVDLGTRVRDCRYTLNTRVHLTHLMGVMGLKLMPVLSFEPQICSPFTRVPSIAHTARAGRILRTMPSKMCCSLLLCLSVRNPHPLLCANWHGNLIRLRFIRQYRRPSARGRLQKDCLHRLQYTRQSLKSRRFRRGCFLRGRSVSSPFHSHTL